MSKTLNMVGGGAKGLFASIFATGVAQSDTVTLTTPSGKVKSGKWATQDSADGFLFEKLAEFGTYTLTANNGKETVTKVIMVDTAAEYQITVDFKLWLYRAGDECEDVTGGWESVALRYTSESGRVGKAPNITRNSNNMVARLNADSSGKWAGGIIRCANTIDLTNCEKLYFSGTLSLGVSGVSQNFLRLVIWSKIGSSWIENIVADIIAGGTSGTFNYNDAALDVSALNGNHVIGFGFYSPYANDYAQVTLNSLYLK